MIFEVHGHQPQIKDNWIAPNASLAGQVYLEEDASIWFGVTIRAETEPVRIGKGTNIQDHTIIHVDPGYPASIGDYATIGHRAIIHGAKIGNNVVIGMGATILNGAVIGDNCIIGAGALITEGKEIPAGSLVVGAPGKVIRQLDEDTIQKNLDNAHWYIENAKHYKDEAKIYGI